MRYDIHKRKCLKGLGYDESEALTACQCAQLCHNRLRLEEIYRDGCADRLCCTHPRTIWKPRAELSRAFVCEREALGKAQLMLMSRALTLLCLWAIVLTPGESSNDSNA